VFDIVEFESGRVCVVGCQSGHLQLFVYGIVLISVRFSTSTLDWITVGV
jgi:hypothetical protein